MQKIAAVAIAGLFYTSTVWASLTFFRVENTGARVGKRIISLAGGASMVVTVLLMSHLPNVSIERFGVTVALYTFALLLFWSAFVVTRLRRLDFAFSTKEPDWLEMCGPYRLIRHPFYAAYLLGWLAPLIYSGAWISATIFGLMTLLYVRAALVEERLFSRSAFANEYTAYRQNTARFVPWLL
jgi:protein-S-isoprenylcysteine O-methyltransferase Ste14